MSTHLPRPVLPFLTLLSLVALVAAAGCEKKSGAEAMLDDLKSTAKGALDSAKATSSETRAETEKALSAKVAELKEKIDSLEHEARSLSGDAKRDAEGRIATLRERHQDLVRRLDKVESASGDAWKDAAKGLDGAADDLRGAFDKAKARFN